jgi:hypothetical protein
VNYLLLLYSDQASWSAMSDEEKRVGREQELPRWYALFEYLGQKSKSVDGVELDEATTAKTLRYENGKPVVTDGPFAETKEQIGGIFFLECENLDEAIDMAARVPVADHGSVEIRPVRMQDAAAPEEAAQTTG